MSGNDRTTDIYAAFSFLRRTVSQSIVKLTKGFLAAFRNMITPLIVCQNTNARIVGPQFPAAKSFNGLPWVLFTCVSHAPTCIVGTSCDDWGADEVFMDEIRQWRLGRFPSGAAPGAPIRTRLLGHGTRIFDAFQAAILAQPAVNMQQPTINAINTAIVSGAPVPLGLGPQFGYHCSNEAGRSFAGRPKQARPNTGPLTRPGAANPMIGFSMFDEICRCWKCRYLHNYNVNAGNPALLDESYRQTALYANIGLSCAEDLVQLQCEELRPAGWVGPNNPVLAAGANVP